MFAISLALAVLLLISFPASGRAATALVQSASISEFSSETSQSVTFTVSVTPGNLIAVYVAWTNTDTLASVTDSLGNTYTLVQNPTTLGDQGRAAGAYAKNIFGGPCTVTMTFSPAAFSARTIIVHEISGADTTDPFDGSAAYGQTDPGTATDAVTSGPITTTVEGAYIFAATTDQGHASGLSAGTGFTGRESFISPVGARSADRIQSPAGSIAATFTNTDSAFADFITVIMAFKPLAMPDTTPPTVSITAPTDGAPVSGTITVSATASDNNVVLAGVQFKLDGIDLGPESTAAPYVTSWNSASVANGAHTLTAVARDAAGNTTTSAPVIVAVDNIGSSQAVISADRRTEWSQAGVVGDIPTRTTICAVLAPGATSTDINDAIAACSNGVVYLNAGTYHLSSGITFGGRSHVTLRGAGPDQTILAFTGADPCGGIPANVCIHGASEIWSGNVPSTNVRNWTAGYAKGTTQLTLDSTAGLKTGTILILDHLDDTIDTGGVLVSDALEFAIEGGAPGRAHRSQQQFVQVIAINGNQVAISPGIHMPNWRASQQPQVWWWGDSSATAVMDGVEDLTLDHTNATETAGIAFHNAYDGWVKNVQSVNANRSHVLLYQAARIEIRDSYFYGTKNAASQSYGVESFTTSDDLVVNNIFQHITAPIMMGPNTGSVMAYNFMTDMYYSTTTWMTAGIQGSHDAGTGMNLFESNVGNGFLMDLYHGPGSLPTLFRNQLTGTEPGKSQGNTIPVNIWAYNRFANVVGNVLGTPGYHTVYENSSSGTTGFPDQSIYVLGYSGVGETLAPGIPYDPLPAGTLFRWGNYDYATNQTQWNPAEVPADSSVPLDHTLPASLFLFSRPGWWGTMPWPAIGPDVTGGQDAAGHAHKIPAQVCFDNSPKDTSGILMFDAARCYPSPQP